jgi:hypothetical protein
MDSMFQVFKQLDNQGLPQEVLDYVHSLDIYYQPEFLACDAHMQGGHYEIAVYSEGDDLWVYPYIVLPIPNSDCFDLSSPYGYAGPVESSENIYDAAEKAFMAEIASRKNVVTEFVRYHYKYNETCFFEQNITNLLNRRIVVLQTKDREQVWMKSFSGTNRNLVRKLQKEGYMWSVSVFAEQDVKAFQQAYHANMVHSGATDFYFFSDSFFLDLIQALGDKLLFAKVEKDGIVYASALFFISGNLATYYLSARNLEFPKVPASNLLLSEMAFWCVDHKIESLNFGGGLSLDENDYLFKFKSNFSKEIHDFHIGKRIHQQGVYEDLQRQFIAKHGAVAFAKVRHILQFYR